MSYNGQPLYDILFPDSRKWLKLSFGEIMVRSGDTLTLEILEVYPGTGPAPPSLAISEVVLQGAH